MANNYYDATGVLVLDRITQVITALFGGFNLHADHPENGKAYIATIAEDNDPSWDDVFERLENLIEDLGLSVPSDDEGGIESTLHLLAAHFQVGDDPALCHLIEHHDFYDNADLNALFLMATRFDDGHGVKAIKFEGAWHSDKPRLFEFGGNGIYISNVVTLESHSSQALALGGDLHSALLKGNLDEGAVRIGKEVSRILAGITDDAIRDALRIKLVTLLREEVASLNSNPLEESL